MKKFLIILAIFFSGAVLISPAVCFSADPPAAAAPTTTPTSSAAKTPQKTVDLDNPISIEANPSEIIGYIIKSFLGIVGGLALMMTVWGGFQWLTSAGNPEKVKKGTSTMVWSIIGLIVVISSYVLVQTIMNFLSGGG